jgi:hypothetical protein
MITKKFIVTIKVDEKNIDKKYSNYKFNWSRPSVFINYLAKSLEAKHLKSFGYEVRCKPKSKL